MNFHKDAPSFLQPHAKEVNRFLNSLSPSELEELNQKTLQSNDEVYKEFIEALNRGECFLCHSSLADFLIQKPCIHWLLRPVGFDKKHAHLVFSNFNYFRIDSYVRWMANTEIPAGNINDLEEERNPDKVIEYTVKYKNLEWSFSCGKGDLAGHRFAWGKEARKPHYHFQMRIDGRPFINYGDFHIPFSEEDLWHLPIMLGMVSEARWLHDYGMGMQDMMTKLKPEELLDAMRPARDESDGTYHLSTFVEAEPGKTLSGTELAELYKKSRAAGVPMAKLMREMTNVGKVTTIIGPGPRVPDQAGRKMGEKKR